MFMHYTEERRLEHGRKTTQTDTQNKFKVTKIKKFKVKKKSHKPTSHLHSKVMAATF